jgi:peptidoglycan/xylan/chitin deacetylase (PgdA/CDA1 family)
MEVGAHTLTHPFLDRLGEAEQRHEIGGSVQRIEERLGIEVAGLAYPGGAFDPHSVAAASASGLRYAVTTLAGDNDSSSPRFELKRRGFDEGMCLGPDGRFSRRLARAELEGAFDGLRRARREAVA